MHCGSECATTLSHNDNADHHRSLGGSCNLDECDPLGGVVYAVGACTWGARQTRDMSPRLVIDTWDPDSEAQIEAQIALVVEWVQHVGGGCKAGSASYGRKIRTGPAVQHYRRSLEDSSGRLLKLAVILVVRKCHSS